MKGLRPPRAPEALKQRVLRAAAEVRPSTPSIWSLLWESRPLRAAWATATLALLAGNVWLSIDQPRSVEQEIVSVKRQLELLSEELALPRVAVSPRVEAMVMRRMTEKRKDER